MSSGFTSSLDLGWEIDRPRPRKAPPRNQSVKKICMITFIRFNISQKVSPYAHGRFKCNRFMKPVRICCILSSRSFFEGTFISFTLSSVSFNDKDAMCNPETNILSRLPEIQSIAVYAIFEINARKKMIYLKIFI